MAFKSSRVPGVRYKEHPTRKFKSRKDRYYTIRYTFKGKTREEGLGWSSQGWTEKKAAAVLYELKFNQTVGKGPFTLAERREQALKKCSGLTFSELFTKYLKQSKIDKKKSTWQREAVLFNKWLDPHCGEFTLDKVTPETIDGLKEKMQKATQSARSICYAISLIRQVINFARRSDLFKGDDPTFKVKKPKVDNRRIRFLNRKEINLLFEKLKGNPQVYLMAFISLHCGLRAGEILNLSWSDVNFESKQILIKDTKTKKNRVAFMTSELKRELKAFRNGRRSGFLFKSKNGNKYEKIPPAFKAAVNALKFNKGVTDIRQRVVFHTLRHTYASWLVMSSVDIYTVQQLMGHSASSMTERYSHLSPAHLKKAVKVFELNLRPKRITYNFQ